MKKIYILFLCLMATFVFTSCENFITEKSEIYVYDSEHGYIEVKCISSSPVSSKYEIISYPEEGYCLKEKNIKIVVHSEHYSENNHYTYSDGGTFLQLDFDTDFEDSFIFSLYHPINVSIAVYFTKIEE